MRITSLALAAALALAGGCGPRINLNSPDVILVTADEVAHKNEKGLALQVYKLQSAGNSCLLLIAGEGVAVEFLSPSNIVIGGTKTALDMAKANDTVQVYNPATKAYKAVSGVTLAAGEAACFGAGNAVIKLPGLKEAL